MATDTYVILTDLSTGLVTKKVKASRIRVEGGAVRIFENSYSGEDGLVGFFLMTPGIIVTREDIQTNPQGESQ